MKLVEIKDIRKNQIWKSKYNNDIIRIDTPFYAENIFKYVKYNCYNNRDNFDFPNEYECVDNALNTFLYRYELIGFLGITHKLENNKLVEISREEFEVDDIISFNYKENIYCIIRYRDTYEFLGNDPDYLYFDNEEEFIIDLKKIGILGVNYEFINNLVEE